MAETRRLVVIMITDMVGYTAAAQVDEKMALRLRREQEELIRPILTEHQGREVKTMGDGFLVEFQSALRATECAVNIQSRLHERNAKAGNIPITLRIGIHLGDVELRNGDIFGDAVNIASRIEPVAEPGGICLSGAVQEQVRNKIPNRLVKLSNMALKGLENPIDLYRVVLPWAVRDSPSVSAGELRVAVLPLANMSPDANDEYFADGLTEELTTNLSAIPGLRVLARTSTMRYRDSTKRVMEIGRELRVGKILEGSVRKSGRRIRVTAQLIDVKSEEHLWAGQYDRELGDIFAIQTEISAEVAGALRIRLVSTPVETSGTVNLSAYTAYLQGRYLLKKSTAPATQEALRLFQQAIAIDPRFSRAYVGIADCHLNLVGLDQVADSVGLGEARRNTERALELDPSLPEGLSAMGNLLINGPDLQQAEAFFRRAIELEPGLATTHFRYGFLLGTENRLREAVQELKLAEDADPAAPGVLSLAGYLAWVTGEPEEALRKWQQSLKLEPGHTSTRINRMEYYASRGERDKALDELETLSKLLDSEAMHFLPWVRALIYAVLGMNSEAEAQLKVYLAAASPLCSHHWVRASVWGAMAELDRAFDSLGKPEDRWMGNFALRFRTNPIYEKLRADPRFQLFMKSWDPPAGYVSATANDRLP